LLKNIEPHKNWLMKTNAQLGTRSFMDNNLSSITKALTCPI
jgi:hypothetical protein